MLFVPNWGTHSTAATNFLWLKKKNERKICLISAKLQTTKSSQFCCVSKAFFHKNSSSRRRTTTTATALLHCQCHHEELSGLLARHGDGVKVPTRESAKNWVSQSLHPYLSLRKEHMVVSFARWPLSFNSDLVSHTYSMMIRVPPHPCPLSNFRGFVMRIAIYLLLLTHSRW
jgi:hypothetical protein